MKYYIIAGEPSGDLHASNLMKALKTQDTNCHFRFWGGDLMKNVGGDLVKHYNETAFMGINVITSYSIHYTKLYEEFDDIINSIK